MQLSATPAQAQISLDGQSMHAVCGTIATIATSFESCFSEQVTLSQTLLCPLPTCWLCATHVSANNAVP
jgi:hypothetical protein